MLTLKPMLTLMLPLPLTLTPMVLVKGRLIDGPTSFDKVRFRGSELGLG